MREKLTKRAVEALKPQTAPYDVRDTELKGFLCRIQPSGMKTFFYQYRTEKGRQTRLKLGAWPGMSPDGARTLASERAVEVARGLDPVERRRAERNAGIRAKQSTLRGFLDGRYESWATDHLKSAAFQLARIRSDFADWMDRPMYELTEFAIEGMRQKWKREGLKPRTINRDIDRLHAVVAKAAKWGVLDRHPFEGLKQLKTDKTGLVRYLNPDEESALHAALVKREQKLREARMRFNTWRIARGRKPLPERTGDYLDHLRPLVLVALNTGLRRAELLGLTWSAVDLHHKLLTVVATNAKSGNTRHVPLNTEAFDVLTAWKERQKKPAADALVFPGSDGRRMKRIDTAWDSLMRTAGIKKFRFHDCRHHFASRLVQAGVPLNTVRELLGHRDIETTMIYAHLAPSNLRAAVDTIQRATA